VARVGREPPIVTIEEGRRYKPILVLGTEPPIVTIETNEERRTRREEQGEAI
jgi:hypothetical protein